MTDFAIPGLMPETSPKFDAQPPWVTLEPHCAASSLWVGISAVGPVTIGGSTPEVAAVRVIMELLPRFWGGLEEQRWVLDSEAGADGSILIHSQISWYFSVPPQPLPLDPGVWDWRMRVVDADGNTTPLYSGSLLITP